jgi:hypothetical protein
MIIKSCEDCGENIYMFGCIWCNEEKYINHQIDLEEDEWLNILEPKP